MLELHKDFTLGTRDTMSSMVMYSKVIRKIFLKPQLYDVNMADIFR